MPRLLIIKLGAAGDVVRTTSLLHLFREFETHWITAPENGPLLRIAQVTRLYTSPDQLVPGSNFDKVICLEDDAALLHPILSRITFKELFGAFLDEGLEVRYTEDSAPWYDMGVASRHGLAKADKIKLANRKSYQEIIFACLGRRFQGERYFLPDSLPVTNLRGDIAISRQAGARWPAKNWHGFEALAEELSKTFVVNFLPKREDILEHVSDVRNHRFLVTPDSLPMHLALGLGIPSAAIFTCTSPWEIHDYGILSKVVSPNLDRYFYSKGNIPEARQSISIESVYQLVSRQMEFRA